MSELNPGGSPPPPQPSSPAPPPPTIVLDITLPAIPPEPSPTSTWHEWDVYLRAIQMRNDVKLRLLMHEASSAHATAQAATAVAMDKAAEMQRLLVQAMERPPTMSRQQMAWEVFQRLPQVTELTSLPMVDAAYRTVEAFMKRSPTDSSA